MVDGVEAAFGDDVDVGLGARDAGPWEPLIPLPVPPPFDLGDAGVTSGGVEGTVSLATGVFDAVACGVGVAIGRAALAGNCGVGVAFGTSKRPRRCDGVGEIIGVEVGYAVAVGAMVAAR